MNVGWTAPRRASAGVGLVQRVASQYPKGAQGKFGCTLVEDAQASVEALGVDLDGRVTGTVEAVILDWARAATIRSAPGAFAQFVGEQVMDGQMTGALYGFVVTLEAIGSPAMP
jgi:hypothetical protein